MKLSTKVAALGVAAASIGTAGVVFAAWTSSVDGTGAAHSTTSDAGTGDLVNVTPVAANDLYPGATKLAYVTVKNDNAYPIIVTKIYSGASRASTGGCVAGTVRTDELANGGSAVVQSDGSGTLIAAGATKEYKLTLRMSNTAADNCKTQDFVIGDGANSANAMHADVESAASANGF